MLLTDLLARLLADIVIVLLMLSLCGLTVTPSRSHLLPWNISVIETILSLNYPVLQRLHTS